MASAASLPEAVFDVDCLLHYELPGPKADFLFQIHALDGMDQRVVSETLSVEPALPHHVYADPTMQHRFLRVSAPAGPLVLHYRARVAVRRAPPNRDAAEVPIDALPDAVMHNLMPTRYCESDLLATAATKLFGGVAPGYGRVAAICDWLQRHVEYRIGSTTTTTTARDVFVTRTGVCRDFAHLGITFCRALNIPARLAVGYSRFEEPPPDFHAMFEAFVGGRWELFDPTRLAAAGELVRIAVGRDAKDVAFATIFGAALLQRIEPLVQPAEGD